MLEWSFFAFFGLVEQPRKANVALTTTKYLSNGFYPVNEDTLA